MLSEWSTGCLALLSRKEWSHHPSPVQIPFGADVPKTTAGSWHSQIRTRDLTWPLRAVAFATADAHKRLWVRVEGKVMEEEHTMSFSWQKTQRRRGDLLTRGVVAFLQSSRSWCWSPDPPDLQPLLAELIYFNGTWGKSVGLIRLTFLLISPSHCLASISLFAALLPIVCLSSPICPAAENPPPPQLKVKGWGRLVPVAVWDFYC